MALQKFAHGANHYCNFKRTALCGENGPFHLISNPSPTPSPSPLLLSYFQFIPSGKKDQGADTFFPSEISTPPSPSEISVLQWGGGGGNIKWNGPMLCTMTKKKKTKKTLSTNFMQISKKNFSRIKKMIHTFYLEMFLALSGRSQISSFTSRGHVKLHRMPFFSHIIQRHSSQSTVGKGLFQT